MKILFIGNSHTYMNDMPELVRQMIEKATGDRCEIFMLAYSGRSLKWHIEEEYFSVRFNVLHGRYDYCVIQEQAHPMPPKEDTSNSIERIVNLCNQANTIPIIFETWAEKSKPENQSEMNHRYRNISKELRVKLAPIGEVWCRVDSGIKDLQDADLYFRDGAHASYIGDYLIAMVITKTITGKLPQENYVTSLDFTVPEVFQPVKECVSDEIIQIPCEITEIIRKHVSETE